MPNEPGVQVEFTPEFKRNIRHLVKKYRHVRSDVEQVIRQLERGETPGDQIQQSGHTVCKIRIKNTDVQKGKRSGYRMIYYLKTGQRVILVTIYSKSEQGDITAAQIRRIIVEHEL